MVVYFSRRRDLSFLKYFAIYLIQFAILIHQFILKINIIFKFLIFGLLIELKKKKNMISLSILEVFISYILIELIKIADP